jgi:hypothetical protein
MLRYGPFLQRMPRSVLIACFLLTPLVAISLVLATCSATLLDCVPYYNDEIHYWNEVSCFTAVGFNGGYFVPNEHPAPCTLTRFGPHGPVFPVLYGCLARVLGGWHLWSGPVFNIVLLMLGAAFWLWCCRLDPIRLGTGIFFLATFWPCLRFLPCTMQEGLNDALAFVLAGLANADVTGKRRPWTSYAFLVAVVLASVVRITWILLLIPWASVVLGRVSWRKRLLALTVIAFVFPACVLLNRFLCAPYPNFVSSLIQTAHSSPSHAFDEFVWRGRWSVAKYFSPRNGETSEVLLRCEVIGLFLVSVWQCVMRSGSDRRAYFFTALNLGCITCLTIALYDVVDWRDYRVVGPHLLVSLLLLLAGNGSRLVLHMAGVNLVFMMPFFSEFAYSNSDRFLIDSANIVKSRAGFEHYVPYDLEESAWGNTVLIDVNHQEFLLLAVPPGIGISFVMKNLDEESLELPPKSKYVILWYSPDHPSVRDRMHLRPLTRFPMGMLYENLDSLSAHPTSSRQSIPPNSG